MCNKRQKYGKSPCAQTQSEFQRRSRTREKGVINLEFSRKDVVAILTCQVNGVIKRYSLRRICDSTLCDQNLFSIRLKEEIEKFKSEMEELYGEKCEIGFVKERLFIEYEVSP